MPKKKTHEEFVKEVHDIYENEYKAIGTYEGSGKFIRIKHDSSKCGGYEFDVRANDFIKKKSKCPNCSKTKKITHSQFLQKVKISHKGKIKVVGKYVNTSTNIDLKCNICSYEWSPKAGGVIGKRKYGCPNCAGLVKHSFNDVKRDFESRGYELIENEYINVNAKMRYRCPNHPNEDLVLTYKRLKRGEGCPHCAGNVRLSITEVIEAFANEGFELINYNYINSSTKLACRCIHHATEIKQYSLNDIREGRNCSQCSYKKRFKKYEELYAEKGYELIDKNYQNFGEKLSFVCNKHPNIEQTCVPHDLKVGRGCAYCHGYAKPTYEEVYRLFESKGYILLEKDYVNTSIQMKCECKKHADFKITLASLKRGHGCPECGKESSVSKRSGEYHSAWKGGVTELTTYLRKNLKDWKLNSLNHHNFKCVITNENHGDLHIHHLEPFHVIRDRVIKELGIPYHETIGEYTSEELDTLSTKFLNEHSKIYGVPLRKDIHELFHNTYGYNNTPEQFEEFKERYRVGEFKDCS